LGYGKKKRRKTVFERKILRRMFGSICERGQWRKGYDRELEELYNEPNTVNVIKYSRLTNIVRVIKSRRMRWAGNVARMGEERGMYRVLVRKPEGKRPLGRPRRRWVDNIRMDLQEVGCGYMDRTGLA